MLEAVKAHYESKLAQFGPTPQGVDWKDKEGQQRRFALLTENLEYFGTVNDLGCGYGELFSHTVYHDYIGYDISPAMIAAATARYPDCKFILGGADALEPADWTLASGLFNVKLDASISEWEAYILRTLGQMQAKSRIGIGFNMLSDLATQRKAHLYYGNVEQYSLWALNQGFRVTVYQDVKHEFTMIVRKD